MYGHVIDQMFSVWLLTIINMYGASLCEHCEPSLSSALLAEMKTFKVKNLVFKLFWYCSSSIFMTKVFFFFIFFFFFDTEFFFHRKAMYSKFIFRSFSGKESFFLL